MNHQRATGAARTRRTHRVLAALLGCALVAASGSALATPAVPELGAMDEQVVDCRSIGTIPSRAEGKRVRRIRVNGLSVSVLLPRGYLSSDRRYPVLYLLHGGTDDVEPVVVLSPRSVEDVVTWAKETKLPDGRRVIDQEWVQADLARVVSGLDAVTLMSWKVASSSGANPADASATKFYATEFYLEAYRLLMGIIGPGAALQRGTPEAELAGRLERGCQGSLILTFGGGTNEIQRDLVALFGLGLPRVPRT